MRIFFILLFITFLHAECGLDEQKISNDYFTKANQAKSKTEQLTLLQNSLNGCFSYEVAFYLFNLKAEQEPEIEQKIAFYDQALEYLSNIETRKREVLREQNRINTLLAKLYAPTSKGVSDIYQKKVRQEVEGKSKSSLPNYLVYLFVFLLLAWGILGIFRK
jgi:succinate dehydrogenase hydrophobic anchor subunit